MEGQEMDLPLELRIEFPSSSWPNWILDMYNSLREYEPPPYSQIDPSCSRHSFLPMYQPPRSNGTSSADQDPPPPYSADEYSFQFPHRMGLTASEREEIYVAISKMENNVCWRTAAVEKTDFFVAQKRVRELIITAESRLTRVEKQEIFLRMRNIYEMRRDWLESELQRRMRGSIERGEEQEDEVKKRKKFAFVTIIILKFIELILNCLCLLPISHSVRDPFFEKFTYYMTFSMLAVVIFLALYAYSGRNWIKTISRFDVAFCLFFAVTHCSFAIAIPEYLAGFGGIFYFIDVCFKMNSLIFEDSIKDSRGSGPGCSNTVCSVSSITNTLTQTVPVGINYDSDLNQMNSTNHSVILNLDPIHRH